MKRNTLFNPPTTQYSSLQDIGKFNMLWQVSIGLFFIFVFLFGLHIAFKDDNWSTSLAAMAVAVLNLIVLSQTRRYRMVGIWSVIIGILIVQASIFIIEDSHIITDTMWCILIAFFTFFLFGPLVGTFVLILNLGGLVGYLFMGSEASLVTKGITIQQVDIKMAVNVGYVALALAFIIFKMVQNNRVVISRYEIQLRQNEILLKEVHHRVKNNLQIVSSLLKLQAAGDNNIHLQSQFEEAIGRIRSMALIHEKMYENDKLSSINLQSYLSTLLKEITDSSNTQCAVTLKVDTEIKKVDIKSIVPLSLMFNELITNSFRHGFPNLLLAEINIHVEQAADKVLLYYSDNGIWKEPEEGGGFGLELVSTLCEQLHGTYERTIDKGTHYRFVLDAEQLFFETEEMALLK